ncbi:uncharacterized protein YgbK (DUF1537 family) [Brevibacterium sanguinis]|uniref:Uncharacterized protein YgbK (DUF1537 family) n=2 Tax=Brevibacterium TaxID=1696 RepID=A0A366IGW6_9MICO|nr:MULTISPECIES: four-carbon acid sugar kinase family protein [Brevibacterium]RBP61995.1 uncharacterized protein YgbK (DUF1537 family) [Brevibacterium sanguinis]RBP70583.1 uncharacterized protein YgbK (DUF1537 family) [Brevibacterium celere]
MTSVDNGLLVLADDLSGAAESAVTLGPPVPILLTRADPLDHSNRRSTEYCCTPDVAVDLDCRYLSPTEAMTRTASAITDLRSGRTVFIKVDSLLRGNIRAHLRASLSSTDGPVIFSPALPQLNRTVVDGVPLNDGIPLAATSAWSIEGAAAPAHLSDLCPERPGHITLESLRSSGRNTLASLAGSRLIIADAATMDDLRRIIDLARDSGAVLVGSAALARAFADRRSVHQLASPGPGSSGAGAEPTRVLFVLGTAARRVNDQIAHLSAHADVQVVDLRASQVLSWRSDRAALSRTADDVRSQLARGDVIVRLTSDGAAVDPRPLPGLLAELTAQVLRDSETVRLAAAGGETARAVLDRLDIMSLTVRKEIHPGAVLSAVDSAAVSGVVTRPGGHGDEDSLTLIHAALAEHLDNYSTSTVGTMKENQ